MLQAFLAVRLRRIETLWKKGFVMKVLIIEDNSRFAGLIEDVLRRAGHTAAKIIYFDSGLDACVHQALLINPDVILLDHSLGVSFYGSDIARELRAKNKVPPIRLISISSDPVGYCEKQFDQKIALLVGSPKIAADAENKLISLL